MIEDAKEINPNIEIITTSAKTGENIDKLIEILEL
jgi:Ni2+-binding GTPase involved in maturation of urease and hydrogenase